MVFFTTALVVAVSLLFGVTGCAFTPEIGEPGGGGEVADRHTPGGMLDRFAWFQSDPHRDLTEYALCLHPQYGFFFTSSDAGVIGEEFWTREQDLAGMQDLFNAAAQITVRATIEDTLETQPCDESRPGDLCTSYAVRIDMTVLAPDPQTHESTTYLVNGRADFVISRDPADSTLYVIREIHDRTNEAGRPAETTATAIARGAGTAVRASSWAGLRRLGAH